MTSQFPAILDLARNNWKELGFGMFIHFGINTFSGVGWGDGRFPAAEFAPRRLNPGQWAEIALEAGMKYAVLTTKHHDGFCLWPSRCTDYSVKNAGVAVDVVAAFVDAFRSAGLKTGLYYSLWDRNFPDYNCDRAYIDYMKAQLTELLTGYGPILEMWFDGGWDKDHPTRSWPYNPEWETSPDWELRQGERWGWSELYDHIHSLQPECLVIQNSSSDRPGVVKYPPVDVRTSEHFDFIWSNRICRAEDAPLSSLPLEYCTTLTPDWFWSAGREGWPHPSAATIADWRRRAAENGGNLLLNLGPDNNGLIPEYQRPFLRRASALFGAGGN